MSVRYVALLRGINVGGKAKVDMKTLRTTFERLGLDDVTTYINSGNVVFSTGRVNRKDLIARIERAIAKDVGFPVAVTLRTGKELAALLDAVPSSWVNGTSTKCDVYFLWPEIDRRGIVDQLPHNPAIEDVRYTKGAVIRRIDRANAAKSPMTKIVGTDLYRRLTARNINTVRKLHDLVTR
jgi:uncharacterized protein (DUF1697 family)